MKWKEMTRQAKNRLIAERVMGYSVRTHSAFNRIGGKPAYYLFDANEKTDWRKECISESEAWSLCPPYSTNMNAAWQIIERFGSAIVQTWKDSEQYKSTPYKSTPYSCLVVKDGATYSAFGTTPQEAICLAALKAVGYVEEEAK